MRKSKKQEETTELEPVTRENIDKYCSAAESVVSDLRALLYQHYYDLTHGVSTAPTGAAQDPPYAAKVHRTIVACDGFSTAVRGVY
jgi:hypothetical protein